MSTPTIPAGHRVSPVVDGQRDHASPAGGDDLPSSPSAGPTLDWTRNVDCSHAVCAGSSCMYVPQVPSIGPDLPVQIRDREGTLWARQEGKVFYARRDSGGYRLALWWDIVEGEAYREWPGGEWAVVGVSHNDGWGWEPLTRERALELTAADEWRYR